MDYDVVAFGEALLRIQPLDDDRVEEAPSFAAFPGGAELNTAYALAHLGLKVAWFSALPEGMLGRRVVRHLRAAGVDTSHVVTRPGRLGTYWVEYGREPRTIEVLYDRKDSTVCHLQPSDIPTAALTKTRAFFVSGITPALSAGARETTLAAARAAREAGAIVATDLNYRARLWSAAEAGPVLEALAKLAHVVIATEDDLKVLYGWTGTPEAVARTARERWGSGTVALTRGTEGGFCLDAEAVRTAATFPCNRLDRIGAGDAFTAGFLYARLTGRAERDLDWGLAMAALKHTVRGDTLAVTPAEVEHVLRRERSDIRR